MKLRQLDYKKLSSTKNNNEWSVDALLLILDVQVFRVRRVAKNG